MPRGVKNEAVDKIRINEAFKSEQEKQRAEQHWWVTFQHNGDDDTGDIEFIGAAGVHYYCRVGQPVLLPDSAIKALELAVSVGWDHGHPVEINGRKYLKRLVVPQHRPYSQRGPVSPEDAKKWRDSQDRMKVSKSDLLPMDGGSDSGEMMDVGTGEL